MQLSSVQRIVLIVGLVLMAGVLHVSHCRWRLGSMGSDVAIIGGPGPALGSPVFYAVDSNPSNMAAWQGSGSIFYAATQPQYGLFSRYGIIPGVIIGVVMPLALLTVAVMVFCSLKRTRRRERGVCTRCGYDLQFDYTRRCSECGWMRV